MLAIYPNTVPVTKERAVRLWVRVTLNMYRFTNELAVFLTTFSLSFGLGVVLVRASKVALTKNVQLAIRVLILSAMSILVFSIDQSTRIAMWGIVGLLAGLTTTRKRVA